MDIDSCLNELCEILKKDIKLFKKILKNKQQEWMNQINRKSNKPEIIGNISSNALRQLIEMGFDVSDADIREINYNLYQNENEGINDYICKINIMITHDLKIEAGTIYGDILDGLSFLSYNDLMHLKRLAYFELSLRNAKKCDIKYFTQIKNQETEALKEALRCGDITNYDKLLIFA